MIGLSLDINATHVSCGDVLTVDTTMDEDLTCTGTFSPLSFGTNDVTLDGAGYMIYGDGTGVGLVIAGGKTGIIIKNVQVKNHDRGFIFTQSASNNSILNSNFMNNTYAGDMYGSNYNTITGNFFADNNALFSFYSGSHNNLISDNLFDNNNFPHSLYDGAQYNTYTGNIFNGQPLAIVFYSGSVNNSAYNNFFNGTSSISVYGYSGSSNILNVPITAGPNIIGGPFIGGNFYGKIDGTGFSQTCVDADSDGICDSSYFISTGTEDFFPLTYGGIAPLAVCTPPPSDLVSWWAGDGNANDIQDGNDGTLQNGATFTGGKVGQAFSFDGIDDEVTVPDNANLNFGTSDFTIDAWVKSTVLNGVIVQKRNPTTGSLYRLEMFQTGSTTSGFQCILTGASAPFALGPINDDVFHHIACVRSGNLLKVYIDGVLEGAQTMASGLNIDTSGGQLFIGSADVGLFWNGIIDEVEIFNRALADSEIQDIYNADTAGKCKPEIVDNDNDGFGDDVDCNDNDANIFPGAEDSACNGVDNNCDGQLDEGYISLPTSCGVGVCGATGQTSCSNGDVLDSCTPGLPSTEVCDNLDNDCDGQADEGLSVDGDNDGYYLPGSCFGPADDCDDNDVNVNPNANEVLCDGLDNNCNGNSDDDQDSDGDSVSLCAGDCNDDDASNFPGNAEICDGADNNCNGLADEGGVCVADGDEDGVEDELDLCPGTSLPEDVPFAILRRNHYAEVDGDGVFEVRTKNSVEDSLYTIEDTSGCSCEQILDIKPGKNLGEQLFGCTKGTMWNFVNGKGWAK